jgi:hypothetical protein
MELLIMGDIFGPEFIDDGSFDGGGNNEGREGGIRATQTVNQNQDQSQDQQQQQQEQPGFGSEGTLGLSQRAKAVNQNVVVGNTGAVTTGVQTATPVNTASVGLGLSDPLISLPITASATSVSYSTNPSTGYSTQVITTPIFTVTIVTPPGVGALPTVTVS